MKKRRQILKSKDMAIISQSDGMFNTREKIDLDIMEEEVDIVFAKAISKAGEILERKIDKRLRNGEADKAQINLDYLQLKTFNTMINFQKLNELRKENLGLTKKRQMPFIIKDDRYNLNKADDE